MHAGKVDCDKFQRLCSQAGVNAYPTVRFYPGSRGPNIRQVLSVSNLILIIMNCSSGPE